MASNSARPLFSSTAFIAAQNSIPAKRAPQLNDAKVFEMARASKDKIGKRVVPHVPVALAKDQGCGQKARACDTNPDCP